MCWPAVSTLNQKTPVRSWILASGSRSLGKWCACTAGRGPTSLRRAAAPAGPLCMWTTGFQGPDPVLPTVCVSLCPKESTRVLPVKNYWLVAVFFVFDVSCKSHALNHDSLLYSTQLINVKMTMSRINKSRNTWAIQKIKSVSAWAIPAIEQWSTHIFFVGQCRAQVPMLAGLSCASHPGYELIKKNRINRY